MPDVTSGAVARAGAPGGDLRRNSGASLSITRQADGASGRLPVVGSSHGPVRRRGPGRALDGHVRGVHQWIRVPDGLLSTCVEPPAARPVPSGSPTRCGGDIAYPDGGNAQVAETTLGGRRLIVRRTRLTGAQAQLFPDWRHHAFVTDRPGTAIELDADHRRHAVCELPIRHLKHGADPRPLSIRGVHCECRLGRARHWRTTCGAGLPPSVQALPTVVRREGRDARQVAGAVGSRAAMLCRFELDGSGQ